MKPRPYSLVRFDDSNLPEEYRGHYPFSYKHRYIFIAEIPNMLGHCIVMDDDGRMYVGYHTENFVELQEADEPGVEELDLYVPVGMKPVL